MTDCDGKTALHLSCSEGHYDVVVIVTLGASYRITSHLIIPYLVQILSRAELDMTDCDGKTALHLSCSEGHYDVVVIVTLEAGKIR